MFIHLHKGVCVWERVCVPVRLCTLACVYVSPLYPSVMNSQLMKEALAPSIPTARK